jgi:predicted HTH transcriptional regulator
MRTFTYKFEVTCASDGTADETQVENMIDLREELPKSCEALSQRMQAALQAFGKQSFTRKDYMNLFPTLSTATASRDLASAVTDGILKRVGEQSQARYKRP